MAIFVQNFISFSMKILLLKDVFESIRFCYDSSQKLFTLIIFLSCIILLFSSLVKGDEQLDQPNSQTTMELCHASVAYFFGLNTNTTAFWLGRSSLHLLLLKSSMDKWFSLAAQGKQIWIVENEKTKQIESWAVTLYF